jgi:demethylmenaquinone methyltransferase/2-methoxy-6-polyprenyl-1,4-benzoquinol methylase
MDELLHEQQVYYRRRAPIYDEDYDDPYTLDDQLLTGLPIHGDVLELACGTGRWTGRLADRADRVTAVDGAPEMLAIARDRIVSASSGTVEFVQADLFGWTPPRRYDTVFFGFWLSHVPPDLFGRFWATVAAGLRPGGAACFIDESDTGRVFEPSMPDPAAPVALRRLGDEEHRVVKVFYAPGELTERLAAAGWSAEVRRLGERFIVGSARVTGRRSEGGPA